MAWLTRWGKREAVAAREYAPNPFWAITEAQLRQELRAGEDGLTSAEARARCDPGALHRAAPRAHGHAGALLLAQFKSPIVLILLAAAGLAIFLQEPGDALVILAIVAASALLGFAQEKGASDAVARLLALVQVNATVRRDGREREVPVRAIVPGDLVILNAGDIVPADGRVLDSKVLFADEATLTGETFPVEKSAGVLAADTPLAQRRNVLFAGTHVVSGQGRMLAVLTGPGSEFGRVSARLRLSPPETEFQRGLRRFGYFLAEVTLVLVIGIFACNVLLARPVLDSLLFALALAVGLTPQLLPAIISVNLARGARRMAARRVILKRLPAIENFASMTVLCVDKTGTLTEGAVRLEAALDAAGRENGRVLQCAALNSAFETGYTNPLDAAIRARGGADFPGWAKLDEEPYDFVRRRLSVLLAKEGEHLLITKGAVASVLAVCAHAEADNGAIVPLEAMRASIDEQLRTAAECGRRSLAVAVRALPGQSRVTKEDEREMTFVGLLTFSDTLKPGIAETLQELRVAGVAVKIVTGDQRLLALDVARRAGVERPTCMSGPEMREMSDEALRQRAGEIEVFAEVEPNQKERLMLALRRSGQVVGFLGDGINDATALHAADVGISVAGAADVAKAAADIVMLDKDLAVLAQGVFEGRRTFANTLKYVFMATSANFGNMFSMAGASLLLPFLPLLPKQILLLNLLSDLPEMAIASDHVDEAWLRRPHRWNIGFIRRFMVVFGLLSSVFDLAMFAVLLAVFRVPAGEFRAAWFVGSVSSAALILLVVRTALPVWQSRPGRVLLGVIAGVALVAVALPATDVGAWFGFAPIPSRVLGAMLGIVALYAFAAEGAKRVFYRMHSLD